MKSVFSKPRSWRWYVVLVIALIAAVFGWYQILIERQVQSRLSVLFDAPIERQRYVPYLFFELRMMLDQEFYETQRTNANQFAKRHTPFLSWERRVDYYVLYSYQESFPADADVAGSDL